jgi:hypothetical protein
MKSPSDIIIGILLIIVSLGMYFTYYGEPFDLDMAFEGLGKLSALKGILYLLFAHLPGAIIGVLSGLYLIFRG